MIRHSMIRGLSGAGCLVAFGTLIGLAVFLPAAAQEPTRHELTVKIRKYQFSPARIDVVKGDIVKVTLVAEDVAHSFVIDEYRIAKRVAPGKPVTFEFRADRAGTFVFYCDLSSDEACKDTRGLLVVTTRQP